MSAARSATALVRVDEPAEALQVAAREPAVPAFEVADSIARAD